MALVRPNAVDAVRIGYAAVCPRVTFVYIWALVPIPFEAVHAHTLVGIPKSACRKT